MVTNDSAEFIYIGTFPLRVHCSSGTRYSGKFKSALLVTARSLLEKLSSVHSALLPRCKMRAIFSGDASVISRVISILEPFSNS